MNLTKSHLLTYLDAPMHLWAEVHDQFEKPLSTYDKHLMTQGYEVEGLARQYLQELVDQDDNLELIWQRTFTDRQYEAVADALIHHLDTDTYDIYEVKSSTEVKKENKYDATFQFLVTNMQIKVDKVYILHLNKEYVRHGDLILSELFVADDITNTVHKMKIDVDIEREKALDILQRETSDEIQPCYNISSCRCLSLCHPDLPDFSIYHIPNLSKKKKQKLIDLGVSDIKDVPDTFELNYKQSIIVKVGKTNQPHIDTAQIRHQFERLDYPLYFLDYETFNNAIPVYDGYKPHQQMVFQYSLHRLDKPDGELVHSEHLSLNKQDPAQSLVKQLRQDIGDIGSVIVWNKTFEMGRNKEMAELYPEYAEFLTDLNERIYDLADVVKDGMYVHPDFKGSWSIKAVLPVLVPHLSYKELAIGKGDEAMITWWRLTHDQPIGLTFEEKKDEVAQALLDYCELDTLAMVEIYKKVKQQIN